MGQGCDQRDNIAVGLVRVAPIVENYELVIANPELASRFPGRSASARRKSAAAPALSPNRSRNCPDSTDTGVGHSGGSA